MAQHTLLRAAFAAALVTSCLGLVSEPHTDGSRAALAQPVVSATASAVPDDLMPAVIAAVQDGGGAAYVARPAAAVGTSIADNAPHGFATRFGPRHVEVSTADDGVFARPLALAARRLDVDGERHNLDGQRQGDGAGRIAYLHAPADGIGLTEWFRNGPLGLQHGFDVTALPSAVERLAVIVDVGRAWTVDAVDGATDGVTLRRIDGAGRFAYRYLRAWDVTGRFLPATMTTVAEGIRLSVDVRGAALPITIDPLLQQAILTPGDGTTGSLFGASVAVRGNRALIGAPWTTVGANTAQGVVYMYQRNTTTGMWALRSTISDPAGSAGDWFGFSVALGDYAEGAIGAPLAGSTGKLYRLFVNDSGNTSIDELTALRATDDRMGWSVAAEGSTIVAGAVQAVESGIGYAEVWGYEAGDDNYARLAVLHAPDGAPVDQFGLSVAISGDTVVVGAPGVDLVGRPDVGAAFVYTYYGPDDTYILQARLDRPGTAASCEHFGASVAISGERVVVGSGSPGICAEPNRSQIHELTRNGATWTAGASFTPSECTGEELCMGTKVALNGSLLTVGLPREFIAGVQTGTVKTYRRTTAGWSPFQRLFAPGVVHGSSFGNAVAATGYAALASVPYGSTGSGPGFAPIFGASPGDLIPAIGDGVIGDFGSPNGGRHRLNRPFGIDDAGNGRVLVADTYNHRVKEYFPDHDYIQVRAGNGTPGSAGDGLPGYAAQLSFPTDVAVDGSGRTYIADSGNHKIRRLSSTSVMSTLAGTGVAGFSGDGGPATSAQFNQPYGLGVDAAGNAYVADTNNHRVRRIDAATNVVTTIAGTGTGGYNGDGIAASSAQLSGPRDVAVAPDGSIYIADTGNRRIRRVVPATGQISTVLGTGEFGYNGEGLQGPSTRISSVEKIAFDTAGNLFVADLYNHRVRRVTGGTGQVSAAAGTGVIGTAGDGGPAISAQLEYPYAVAVTPSGVFIVEQDNTAAISRVRKIEPAGMPLIYTRAGTGLGSVSMTPPGVVCDTSCTNNYSMGSTVTLVAAPATTATFTGWSGDCTGTNNCVVTMSQARNVTATFTGNPQQLSASVAGTGTGTVSSTPAGISCGPDCSETYPYNTSVTLTATAGANSVFSGWSGDCTGTGTCTVMTIQARSVTATFGPAPQPLTVTRTGAGVGSVSSNPAGISCGADCTESYSAGTSVTLSASANAGSTFSGWTGEGCSGTGTCTVSMTQARSVAASFAPLGQGPTILSRVPALGSTAGGTIVIITGQQFVAGTTVRIASQPLAAQITGTTEIRIVTPPSAAGPQTITVQTPHGEATTTFEYMEPEIHTRSGWRRPAFAASRYTAFESAIPMLPEDTNGISDIYVHDDVTDTLRRVSVSATGQQAIGGESVRAAIDPSGRFVAFESLATNLVPGDTNGLLDVFVHDRDSDDDGAFDELGGTATVRASVSSSGDQALGGGSGFASLDGTGRFIAFQSSAGNLVLNDTNPGPDVFVHDRLRGLTSRVSIATDTSPATAGSSLRPAISQNGRFVAFDTAASLVPSDGNGARDVYVHDRDFDRDGIYDEATGVATRRVSIASSGTPTTSGDSVDPSITGDGRYVVFASDATTLVPGDTNGVTDIFIHDRDVDADGVFDEAGQVATRRLSVGAGGVQLAIATGVPRISANGVKFVFLAAVPVSSPVLGSSGSGAIVQAVASDPGKSTGGWGNTPTEPDPDPEPDPDDGGVIIEPGPPDQDIEDPAIDPDGDRRGGTDVSDTPAVVIVEEPEHEPTPFIGGISPAYGAPAGGALVTISGRDLDGTLYWNGAPLATAGRTPTEWTAVAPARGGGPETASIHIQAGDRRSNAWSFTYVAQSSTPRWTDHQPRSAPVTGGGTLVISGSGFVTPSVRLGSYATTVTASTPTSVSVAVPPALVTGAVPVVIVNADGAEAISGDPFTYENGAGSATVQLVQPQTISSGGGEAVTIFGSGFQPGTVVTFGERPAANVQVLSSRALLVETPSGAPGSVALTVAVPGQAPVSSSITYAAPPVISLGCTGADVDGDGMDDVWERQFGLAAGDASDGVSDPDYDGRTSAEECVAGTHPRGLYSRFLAEGATGSFFQSRVVVANPGSTPARVLLRFQTSVGQTPSKYVLIPAMSRYTVTATDVAGLAAAEFSTVVESDVDVVVDRTMLWGLPGAGIYGSHAESSLVSPRTEWYLAEGATTADFQLYYLLQNPNPTAAIVRVRYLRPGGRPPIERDYTVPAQRRVTIGVDLIPGLEAAEVSAALRSLNGVPFIVERAMYKSPSGRTFEAGHNSAGIDALSTQWFFAEGATGALFNTYLLLANPNDATADVTIRYLLSTGATVSRSYQLLPNSRTTIPMEDQAPELAAAEVSSVITVTNGVAIAAERAMWWPGYRMATAGYPFPIIWGEAHNSPGATATGTKWAVADGETGPAPANTKTFILIANTSPYGADVSVTLLGEHGQAPIVRHYTMAANSRFTVDVRARFPETDQEGNRTYSAIVESHPVNGQPPAEIVVERAMYSDAVGIVWAAGSNLLATRLR